eukprot:GCRY01003682.1.p1 GENE.GCRY01003682.1~~GCRY01003682.1.p1  ORF type:complete len:1036 (-),score=365.94 GCRY01003682.1:286-3393(-)
MSVTFDGPAFFAKASKIYEDWKSNKQNWENADCLFLCVGGVSDENIYQKSLALQQWLLGHAITDLVMVFTESAIYVLSGSKKVKLLTEMRDNTPSSERKQLNLEFLTRNKSDADAANFKQLVKSMKDSFSGKSVGHIVKDKKTHSGDFIASFLASIKDGGFTEVDVSAKLSFHLAIKSDKELRKVKKAAAVTSKVFESYFIPKLEGIVDQEKTIRHSELSEMVEARLDNPDKISGVQVRDDDYYEACYPPIIQSGGDFSLKPSAESSDENLHFGIVLCSMGCRYNSFCSNIGRTLLFNPTEEQEKNYEVLLKAHAALLEGLKPGATLAAAYAAALAAVERKKPALAPHFFKNCGFGMGIEFKETGLNITAKNEAMVRVGMVFNVVVGFTDLVNPDAADPLDKTYAMQVVDTVVVAEAGPQVLTPFPTALNDLSYSVGDEEESEEEEETSRPEARRSKSRSEVVPSAVLTSDRPTRQRAAAAKENIEEEEHMKKHQRELSDRLILEGKRRYQEGASATEEETVREFNPKKDIAYKSSKDYPQDLRLNQIYVDPRREALFVPICGQMVPFQIAAIKNAQKVDGDPYTELRVNLHTPGQAGSNKFLPTMKFPDSHFVREFTYRTQNPQFAIETVRKIKEIQKRIQMRDAEKKAEEATEAQENLVLASNRNIPRLQDVFIRPNITARRSYGILEAHTNGFRFTSVKNEKVDIIYKNIRHAFFQSSEKELIVIVHFTLKQPISLGKKRVTELQFCTEVQDASEALDSRRHRMGDADELGEEQRERELRKRLDAAFQQFVRKVEEIEQFGQDFDIPYRDLGFFGCPHRQQVFIMPTVKSLVALVEVPFFVLSLDAVEICSLERVQFGVKSFDMVFLFKDLKKQAVQINSIPMAQLEAVKEWLDSVDIRFYESPNNLNWSNILKRVRQDPFGFYDDGGWGIFLGDEEEDGAGEEEEEEESAESVYNSEMDGSEDEESEEDYSDGAGEEEESGSDYDDSEEESGADWSDLEAEAAEEDRKAASRHEVEDQREIDRRQRQRRRK